MSKVKASSGTSDTQASSNSSGNFPDDSRSSLNFKRILWSHHGVIGLAIVASVVTAGLALVQPVLLNQLISSIGSGQTTETLLIGLILLLGANLLTASLQQFLVDTTAEKIVWSLRTRVVEYALEMPLETLKRFSSSQVISRVGTDAATLRTALTGGIFDSLGNVLLMVGALVAMSLVDLYLLLVTLTVVIVSFSVVLGVFRITRRSSRKNQEAVADVTTSLDRALSGIRTIRIYNATEKTRAALRLLLSDSKRAGIRLARIQAFVSPANGLAVQGSVLAVLGVGGFRVADGSLTVADLVTFVAYLFLAVVPMSQLLSAVGDVSVASGALDRIRELVEQPRVPMQPSTLDTTLNEELTKRTLNQDSPLEHTAPTVALTGVAYQHGQSGFRVNDATCVLEGGSIVALVGPSGSGKSTVLDLLSGLIVPDSGSIQADDSLLNNFEVETWRSQIAYVEQSHGIISGTVRENLDMGRPGATDEELGNALLSVNLTHLATKGPHGLDLIIDQEGTRLSGGERQRLAIARAILSRRPIVLFDEPSANLDSGNVKALIEALQSLRGSRTVLISTHSSEIAAICDRVLHMADGVVHG